MTVGCQSPQANKGTSGDDFAGTKGKRSQVIYSSPILIKPENCPISLVHRCIREHPGLTEREVQRACGYYRGNSRHTEMRGLIRDSIEILWFSNYITKIHRRFYATGKTLEELA